MNSMPWNGSDYINALQINTGKLKDFQSDIFSNIFYLYKWNQHIFFDRERSDDCGGPRPNPPLLPDSNMSVFNLNFWHDISTARYIVTFAVFLNPEKAHDEINDWLALDPFLEFFKFKTKTRIV